MQMKNVQKNYPNGNLAEFGKQINGIGVDGNGKKPGRELTIVEQGGADGDG